MLGSSPGLLRLWHWYSYRSNHSARSHPQVLTFNLRQTTIYNYFITVCWPSFVQRFCRKTGSQIQLPIGNKLTLRAQQFPELIHRSQITEERGKNTRWPLCLSCSHPQHYFPICPRSPHSIYSLLSESSIPLYPFHLIAYVRQYSLNSH
jgi:hypothetical protein